MDTNSENYNNFCLSLFNRYYECLRINIDVFGKERGLEMCENLNQIINNSNCKNFDNELNKNKEFYIDKMASSIEKKNKSNN